MRRASLVAAVRVTLLALLVGLLGSGVAAAHHHDDGTTPVDRCGVCTHAAPVATEATGAVSVEPAPVCESVAPAPVHEVRAGCRPEPRGRGPPPAAPVL